MGGSGKGGVQRGERELQASESTAGVLEVANYKGISQMLQLPPLQLRLPLLLPLMI